MPDGVLVICPSKAAMVEWSGRMWEGTGLCCCCRNAGWGVNVCRVCVYACVVVLRVCEAHMRCGRRLTEVLGEWAGFYAGCSHPL